MKFYSYNYVLSRISTQNWGMLVSAGLLLIFLMYTLFQYYHSRKDSKYRELAIILVISVTALCLMFWGNYQVDQSTNNQYQTSLHFIEVVSEDLGVDKSDIYVNTSAATDGAIIYVNGKFYRAISGSDEDAYILEKIDLYNNDSIELVEEDS